MEDDLLDVRRAAKPCLVDFVGPGVRRLVAEFFRPVRETLSFQGYTIPPGAVLAASVLEIHQDESLYPEPETFRPSRFLDRRFAPHEFAAFGGGHRHCLGSAFALAEMAIVLGTILPRFRFELASNQPLGIQRRNVTLAPAGGVEVIIEHR
ncbi:MAG: cytochrome P450 [bacterium]|nr:cytochrome P450 [bacterium]